MAGFLKKGADSKKLAETEKAQAEIRKNEQGKPWRFSLKKEESAFITFVDGEVDHEGFLVPPRLYEHNLKIAGKWGNLFVCPEQSEPEAGHKCPICATGDRPTLYSAFTVIDHRVTSSKDGTKTYQDQRRLMMATPTTYELLFKHAQKRGGLAGARFEVSRSADGFSPAAGDFFDFEEKTPLEELKGKWVNEYTKDGEKVKEDQFTVIDYDNAFNYYTPDELLAMPMFGGNGAATNQATAAKTTTDVAPVDYEDQL